MTVAVDEISKLRRAYFALARELRLEDSTRRDLNARLCAGKRSTTEFGLLDWRAAVAELQILSGQAAEPGRPRLRNRSLVTRHSSLVTSPPGFDAATAQQVALIESLAARIFWRKSAAAFVRARVLRPLRQATWGGSWPSLSRAEATAVIIVFQKMARAGAPKTKGAAE